MLSTFKKNIASRGAPVLVQSSARVVGRRVGRTTLALLLGTLFGQPAFAELSDTIHPFVSGTLTYDDNLLRLSDGVGGLDGGRSDFMRRVDGGVLLERPIGRQLLTAKAMLSRVSFQRFEVLDYNARDLSAALKWQLGNQVSGNAGVRYAETLAAFSDSHTEQRNLREQKREFADANWRFHPSWQVHGAVSNEKFSYELPAQRFNDRTEAVSEVGVDYLAPSSSKAGLLLRRVKNSYDQLQSSGGILIDNGFVQNEVKANVYWAVNGVSQLIFVGGWVQRKHDLFSARDDSGVNGRLIGNWSPLGKVRLTGMLWREFTAAESTNINSALTTGESVSATWQATSKIKVEAQLRRENRDFKPFNNAALIGLTDSTRGATLGVNYSLTPGIALGVSAYHDARTGSLAAGTNTYRANGVSINATGQF